MGTDQSSTFTVSGVEHGYTAIPTSVVRDSRLSLKARGLLIMMLTYGAQKMTRQELIRANPESRWAITSALEELSQYGYVRCEPLSVQAVLPEAQS